jgi:hypothetical protein
MHRDKKIILLLPSPSLGGREGFFDKEGNEIKINFKICEFAVYDSPISHLLRNLLFSKSNKSDKFKLLLYSLLLR